MIGMAFAPAAALSTEKNVGFLDLPPEIRNIIYQLVFKYDEPIEVSLMHSCIDYPSFGTAKTATQLLRVCRQVNGEAIPVFYGSNIFDVWNDATFHDFVNWIGSSAKHLRHLKLTFITNQSQLRSALHRLKQAKAFETFEWVCDRGQLDLLKNFVPWLKALKKIRQAGGKTFDALDVLRFMVRKRVRSQRFDAELVKRAKKSDQEALATFQATLA